MKIIDPELIIQRTAGGSLVERKPVFSEDAQILYVVWGPVIRAYSIKTGAWMYDYEGLKEKAVGVSLHPINPNAIVACSIKGELIQWDCRSKLVDKTVNLKFNYSDSKYVVIKSFHLIQSDSNEENCNVCVVWKKERDDSSGSQEASQIAIFCSVRGTLIIHLKFSVNDGPNSVAFGGRFGQQYVAAIYENSLQFSETMMWKHCDKQIIGGNRVFTCVACHPEEPCIATGDNIGRVLIWWNILTYEGPSYSIYHWHTLPTKTVTFSRSGNYFYSGGGECVLVKWTVDTPHVKDFLPRLPSDICHLVVGPENKYIAISTSDNGIRIFSSQRILVSLIQHMTWSVDPVSGVANFPAGITVDPHTKTIVLNGRVGHIQFFSPTSKSLLYNVDITGLNYITQERHEFIYNTEVTRVSFSSDGSWMATVEERNDKETCPEIRLKFWQFDVVKQSFTLNTSVELHNNGSIKAIAFQPTSDPEQQMVVTAGNDFKFRNWCRVDSSNIYKEGGVVWKCESVCFYRNLPIGSLSFSFDGSLLAVTFGPMLTIWEPETNQLKCSLTESHGQSNLTHVEFGMVDSSHLVVTGSSEKLNVWNLLTLSLVWTVPVHVHILVADPCSHFMAVFTVEQDLFVFSPSNSRPVYIKEKICENSSILCAAFVPHYGQERNAGVWQQHSRLYFLDSNQDLLTLDSPSEESHANLGLSLPVATLQTRTPFASLIAKHATSDVKEIEVDTEQQLGVPGAAAIKELLSVPAHTMPPINLLCGSLLRSLVVSNKQQLDEKEEDKDKENELEADDSSSDSEDETSGHKMVKELRNKTETKSQLDDTKKTIDLRTLESNLMRVEKESTSWASLLIK